MTKIGIKVAAGLACTAALALSAGPAAASTLITATYRGTVTSLLDVDGRLGAVIDTETTTSLAFTDTYVFDLAAGTRLTDASGDQLFGGSLFGTTSPLVSSNLTIGGVTLSFLGDRIGQEINSTGGYIGSAAQSVDANNVFSRNDLIALTNAPALITTPYSGSATPGFGSFAYICAGGHTCAGGYSFRADLSIESVEVTTTSSAPEPASWALIILGFGGLGAALRRARAGAVATS
jgi:hypothetical protein